MNIRLKREGIQRTCPLGFSWTTLIFGWMVPFFRWDFQWGLTMMVGAWVLPTIWEGYTLSWGHFLLRFHLGVLLNIIMAIFYNAIYVAELLQSGFLPVTTDDEEALFAYGLYIEEEEMADGET
ncbi:MAG: hypothetical protein FWF59_15685 [Turicibacter sp.]|nr:hypothetical protein [Turicibacter sp.]